MRYEAKPPISMYDDSKPDPGSIEALDPHSSPIPGQSLTMRPGSQKFERPPQFTNPDDCIMFVLDRIEQNHNVKEDYLRQMASGVPVEYIVNTISFVGFSEGMWSPDVAELIKPPLAMYFMMMGLEEEIPVVLFNPEAKDNSKISDEEIMENMQQLNPQAFNYIQQRAQGMQAVPEEEQGFLDMLSTEGGPAAEEGAGELPVDETIPQEGMI